MKKVINTRHAKHPVQSGVKTSACARYSRINLAQNPGSCAGAGDGQERETKALGTHEAKHVSPKTAKESRIPSRTGEFSGRRLLGEGYIILPRLRSRGRAKENEGWTASGGVGDRCQNTVKRHVVNLRAGSLRSRARDWPRRRKNVRETATATWKNERW